jgi:hypothetical protein
MSVSWPTKFFYLDERIGTVLPIAFVEIEANPTPDSKPYLVVHKHWRWSIEDDRIVFEEHEATA